MNPTMFEIGVATVMVAVSVALIVWIRRYLAAASERRMMSMLKRAGLDPEIATHGDTEAIIEEIRRRCRRCPSEALCDRWLAREETGGNIFCPNAQVFDMLTRTTAPVDSDDPAPPYSVQGGHHRWQLPMVDQ